MSPAREVPAIRDREVDTLSRGSVRLPRSFTQLQSFYRVLSIGKRSRAAPVWRAAGVWRSPGTGTNIPLDLRLQIVTMGYDSRGVEETRSRRCRRALPFRF